MSFLREEMLGNYTKWDLSVVWVRFSDSDVFELSKVTAALI